MKEIFVILAGLLLLLPNVAYAQTSSVTFAQCLNDTYKFERQDITLVSSGNVTNTTVLSKTTFCSNGCSTSVNDCRLNKVTQLSQVGLIIGALIILLVVMTTYPAIAIVLGISGALLIFTIAITDIFAQPLPLIMMAIAGMIAIYTAFLVGKARSATEELHDTE